MTPDAPISYQGIKRIRLFLFPTRRYSFSASARFQTLRHHSCRAEAHCLRERACLPISPAVRCDVTVKDKSSCATRGRSKHGVAMLTSPSGGTTTFVFNGDITTDGRGDR